MDAVVIILTCDDNVVKIRQVSPHKMILQALHGDILLLLAVVEPVRLQDLDPLKKDARPVQTRSDKRELRQFALAVDGQRAPGQHQGRPLSLGLALVLME